MWRNLDTYMVWWPYGYDHMCSLLRSLTCSGFSVYLIGQEWVRSNQRHLWSQWSLPEHSKYLCIYEDNLGGWYFEESGDRTDKLWIWPVWRILTISGAAWDVCKAFLTEILEATGGVLAVRKLSGFPRQLEHWPSLLDRVQSLVTHCQDQKLKLGSSATADNLRSTSSVCRYLDRHVRETIASIESFAWLMLRTLHFFTCSRPVLSESGQHNGHSGTLYWRVWPSTM